MNNGNLVRSHYPALDGLRGVAILLVVLFHNFGFIPFFSYGWLGVDLFFVLSGFLITNILLDTLNSPNYLRDFYARRVLRIFPLYYLCLLLFLILFPLCGFYTQELKFYTSNQWWFWAYMQNWLFAFHLPGNANMLNHFWTLGTEEQFYIAWPLLILLIRKPKTLLYFLIFLLTAVMVTRYMVWFAGSKDLNYINLYTFTRIDGICIGSMVALLYRVNKNFFSRNTIVILAGLVVFNMAFFLLDLTHQYSYPYFAFVGYPTFSIIFGLLLNAAIHKKPRLITLLLSLRPLRFLGKISYGFYIFHWPVFLITNHSFYIFFQQSLNLSDGICRLLAPVTSTFLAILISTASYYGFEIRFLKLKEKFR
jgi:peptidoglycan/LPS O-acetylase OafA/YrhL